jgi:hypothetical protein
VPSFTKASAAFGTGAFRLGPTPEHVFAYPAIDPFTLVDQVSAGFAHLASFRRFGGVIGIAHFVSVACCRCILLQFHGSSASKPRNRASHSGSCFPPSRSAIDAAVKDGFTLPRLYRAGAIKLISRERNELPNRAKHADSYAVPAIPVISAQV